MGRGARGGRGRKKANNVTYHGIVITGKNSKNYLYNMNSIFSNYALRGKVANAPDPLMRSAIHRALSYIIKKRREEVAKEKRELSKIPEGNSAVVKRYMKKIEIHEKMLNMYTNFLKYYHSVHHPNTRKMFNVWKVNYNKRPASVPNGGYRYFAVFPPKSPKKINA